MLLQLSPHNIIFFSFVLAFLLVTEATIIVRTIILRWYYYLDLKKNNFSKYNKISPKILELRKPWDCMKCMTGWCALTLALLNGYGWESFVWCGVGIVAGAIFEAIKMRWL